MGFWSKLLGKKDAKLNLDAVDRDGDGKVQDGTVWERPTELTVDLDDKAKAQARAAKAAATRAANKAKKEAETAKSEPAKKPANTKKK